MSLGWKRGERCIDIFVLILKLQKSTSTFPFVRNTEFSIESKKELLIFSRGTHMSLIWNAIHHERTCNRPQLRVQHFMNASQESEREMIKLF